MPTSLDRIQCLMGPDTYASVLTLCNITGKTKSNMAAELIEASLKNPKYRSMLQEANDEIVVSPKEDPRTEARRRTTHRQPSARLKEEIKTQSKPLPKVWSEEAEKERAMRLIDKGPGEFYTGMTSEEIDAWDRAAWEHEQRNNHSPEMTFEQYQKLQHKRLRGEITGAEYVEAGVTQPLRRGEEKEVREMQQKGELLRVIGEQDDRIKGLESSLAEIKDLLIAKT